MLRLVSLVVVLGGVLGACAAPTWHKEGAAQVDFEQALARCRMRAAGLPPDPDVGRGNQGQQLGRAMENFGGSIQFMNDCLTAEGWSLR